MPRTREVIGNTRRAAAVFPWVTRKVRSLLRRIASAATMNAVERIARVDRHHAATVEQWDANPWVLNTPHGVIDLRTGTVRAATREDYCTKITAVAPGGECPLWLRTLARITNFNQELQQYLQRLCGSVLTGITRDQTFFFFYGTGANGKSVFVNTIAGVLGDYARTAAMETFTASTSDQHPTDLAGLQGARLVVASEIEDGKRFAISKLKRVTGGDKVSARLMRQDFFEFVPQFKLVIVGNHKPEVGTIDEAVRRRLQLIPFTVTIPENDRDPELHEKLRAEWPGILRWMVDGCLAWQREGLNPPYIVRITTEGYLAEEDTVGRWLEARTELTPVGTSLVSELFENWRGWCSNNCEPEGSVKRFSQALQARGFTRERSSLGGRCFRGLVVKRGFDI